MSQSQPSPAAPYLYASETHNEAFARLHFLVQQQRRLGLLLGEHGSGKSLLLDKFAGELRRHRSCVVRLGLVGLDEWEFVWELSAQLGHCPSDSEPLHRLWRRLTDGLIENRYQQLSTVVLLDDADQANGDVQIAIQRLVQCNPDADARLTVVLSADRRTVERLGGRLLDLAELRIDLDRWEPADTAGYLSGRTSQAAAGSSIPFAVDAQARLHELCDGLPRHVSQLTDLALLAGQGGHLDVIDTKTVEAVYQELAVSPGSPSS